MKLQITQPIIRNPSLIPVNITACWTRSYKGCTEFSSCLKRSHFLVMGPLCKPWDSDVIGMGMGVHAGKRHHCTLVCVIHVWQRRITKRERAGFSWSHLCRLDWHWCSYPNPSGRQEHGQSLLKSKMFFDKESLEKEVLHLCYAIFTIFTCCSRHIPGGVLCP